MKSWKPAVMALLCVSRLFAACGGESTPLAEEPSQTTSQAIWSTSPVAAYGRLKVCGTKICSAGGSPIQLRGMSLFWSNTGWGGEKFYNASVVNNLADTWNATVVRATVGVEESGGYLESPTTAAAITARVKAVVDAAIAKGVYVIVDWHSSSNAVYQSQAVAFFSSMARTYASSPNIIWEPFNEPTSNSWSSLKTYHQAVISAIRSAGSQNLVVVGSPTWSQDVDVAAADPLNDPNTAYTLHFYAGTHGQSLRDKANTAMSRGVAVFVTEYGTCDASGNGNFNPTESANWTLWMNSNGISSANWSLNDKAETASALTSGASTTGPWPASQLTQSGAWVKAYILPGYGGGTGTSYMLTVAKAGTGSGTVTSSPAGVSCGSTCSASYASGTSVTLTAAVASGSTFAGWSGACSGTGACTVSMTAARSITATFNASGGSTPCANPITFTNGQSGNFNTTGAVCYRTAANIAGWGCYNFDGRTVAVNNTATTCGKMPLPAKWSDGYSYFAVSGGTYPWAGLYYW